MITYEVLPGDNLTKIKKKFGLVTSIDDIVNANVIIKDPNKIQVGWILKLPETYNEIKAIKTMAPGYKEVERPEGFAPIIGPEGKEWFPPTARGITEKAPVIEKKVVEFVPPLETGKDPSYYYQKWLQLPPEIRITKGASIKQLYEESLKREASKHIAKPITWKEALPYFPEAFSEVTGIKQVSKPFSWYYEKIYKPSLKAVREMVVAGVTKPIKFYKLSEGDIAAINRASRLGLVDSAVANAYFERDMRNELSLEDFVQVALLKDKVIGAKIKGLLKK